MEGGFSTVQPVDEEIASVAYSVKGEVEGRAGRAFAIYEPLFYRTQVVTGFNHDIKILVDSGCVHIRVYCPPPESGGYNQLTRYQGRKSEADPL